MELKNIFKMTKTDRYTQDGRDELAKLQETEDVKYKTGDISQKTGLQKQPDGSWAPPKSNGVIAQQKQKMEAEKYEAARRDAQAPSKKTEVNTPGLRKDVQEAIKRSSPEEIKAYIKELRTPGSRMSRYFDNPDLLANVYEDELNKITESKPAAGSKLESDFDDEGDSTGTNWQEKVEQNPRDGYNFEKMIQHRIPTSQTDREELKGLRSFMNEEKTTYQNALKSRAQALVDGHKSNGDWYPEKEQAIMKIAKAVGFDEELHKFIEEENRGYDLGYSEDSAPKIRELTGDCKIRIRPETQDKVYQIGEISQKTGLQKTANGWRPVKKGADQKWVEKKEKKTAKEIMSKAGPGRTFELKMGENGQSTLGKEVKTYETRKEAQEALKKQKAESKPVVKLGDNADTYNFDDPDSMSNEDKVFKSLTAELDEKFGDRDGRPENVETWANAWLDNTQYEGGLGIKSRKTGESYPLSAEEVMKIVEENPTRWSRIIGNAKKFYEGKGRSTDFESDEFYPIKLVGGKTKPSAQYYAEGKRNEKNNPLTGKYVTQRQNTSKDSAPRILTGDTKIRVKK